MNKIKIGVSSCLIKERDVYIVDTLGKWFEIIPGYNDLNKLKEYKLSGFIYSSDNNIVKEIATVFPAIPIENHKDLKSSLIRDRFVTSIFILNRWRSIDSLNDSIKEFHNNNRFLLRSFNAKKFYELNYIQNRKYKKSFWEMKVSYEGCLMELLKTPRSRSGIAKSLLRMFTIFKNSLSMEDRYELQHMIKQYSRGVLPLLEPITLISHYVKSLAVNSLLDQSMLNPDPIELNLLYHS